jgi:hypothetical protein
VAQFAVFRKKSIPVRVFFNLSVTVNGGQNAELTDIENMPVHTNTAAIARLNPWWSRNWQLPLKCPLGTSSAGCSAGQTTRLSHMGVVTECNDLGVNGLLVEVTNTHGTPAVTAPLPVIMVRYPRGGRSFVCLFVRSLSVVAVRPRTQSRGTMAIILIVRRPAQNSFTSAVQPRDQHDQQQPTNTTTEAAIAVRKD